jgi:hypothetical protein
MDAATVEWLSSIIGSVPIDKAPTRREHRTPPGWQRNSTTWIVYPVLAGALHSEAARQNLRVRCEFGQLTSEDVEKQLHGFVCCCIV